MTKSVLITGASRGIGRAFADIFARNQYSLILVARSESDLLNLKNELETKYQSKVTIVATDLSSPGEVDSLLARLQSELSQLDVLVNNAGFGAATLFSESSSTDVIGMVNLNILALTRLTHGVLGYMAARKSGYILNVASTAAFMPGPYMAEYYASKAYVLSFSQALHEEYRKAGVLISTLCPGVTDTGFAERAGSNKSRLTGKLLKHMTPEEVAEYGYQGLMRGGRLLIPGWMNKLSVFMTYLAPTVLAMKITAYLDLPR